MQYYISENGQAAGPFTIDDLRMRSVTPETLVWYEGLSSWVRADSIEAIRRDVLHMHPGQSSPEPADADADLPRFCPSTYLLPSILLTVCCCNPIAIVAIVFALRVQPAYARGEYRKALENSFTARRWCWIAFIVWLVLTGISYIVPVATSFYEMLPFVFI